MITVDSSPQHRTLVSLALIVVALLVLLATVHSADARPTPQEVIEPSGTEILLDFVNADARNAWRPLAGNWRFQNRIYIQDDVQIARAVTYYDKIIGDDDYWFEVQLSLVSGQQSGLLFNVVPSADDPAQLDIAYTVRFADGGSTVEWGFYRADDPAEFLFQGSVPVDVDVTEFVQLRVAVQGDEFTIWLADRPDDYQLLTPTPIVFAPQPSPRVGLFTGEGQSVFQEARLLVGPFENPTLTPTPLPTETPLPTSTDLPTPTPTYTPSPTPTPTFTNTPNPAVYFEPQADAYTLALDGNALNAGTWIRVTVDGWEALEGGGLRHPSVDRADDILVQNRRVNGDYTLRTSVRMETLGTAPAGAGLTFNAISITARNGAYVVFFDGNSELRWGYFQGDRFEQQGQATLNRDEFGLNNLADVPMDVTVQSDRYGITVNGRTVAAATSVQFATAALRVDQPYVGLFATRADAIFPSNTASLQVSTFTRPTPTVTPTLTGTPPTGTPDATTEPTPASGQFEPQNSDALPYVIDVTSPGDIGINWRAITGDGWQIDENAGMRHLDPTRGEDLLLQSRRVNGDYTLTTNVQIIGYDASIAHGAGLTFYTNNSTGRNGAYIVSFDGAKLRWGYLDDNPQTEGDLDLQLVNEVNIDESYQIGSLDSVPIRVDVTSDHYSIFVNDVPVPGGQAVRFVSKYPRLDQANYFGLYASRINALFPSGTVTLKVRPRQMPTPTPTLTFTPVTPTNTPVTPAATSTPVPTPTRPTATPTWTWTPTFTPWPTSPLPTPTFTPTPQGQGEAVITTPIPSPSVVAAAFNSPMDANATGTAEANAAASTAVAALTLTAQVTPTPTWTTAPQQPMSPLPPSVPEQATAMPATPAAAAVTVVVVAPEASPTQRPVITPTPTPTVDSLMLMARIIDSTLAAAGWIWFMLGSLVFFTVAGVLAGLSFRQSAQRRYELVDDPAVDNPFPVDDGFDVAVPLTRPSPPEPPDDWPSSLP